jgi:hypothetical protein
MEDLVKKYYDQLVSLSEWGYHIVFFPELNLIFNVSFFTASQVSNSVDYHKLKGQDITTYVEHFEANIKDKQLFATKLMSLNTREMTFHQSYKFISFSAM